MKFGALGTGMVGKALAAKLTSLGHEVLIGSRADGSSYAQAAAFGEMLMGCTKGTTSLDALRTVDRRDLAGKVLIDVSNPLDFSHQPATLSVCNTDSLGEMIQREFPELRVVKALNTCNCRVMVDPVRVPGEHDLFIAGNDAGAKQEVTKLLRDFGWRSVIDAGDISGARATEAMMLIWLRLHGRFGTADLNYRIVK